MLIPVPQSSGRADYTLELANTIRIIRQDCEVADILSGAPRKKLYDIKKVKTNLKGVRTGFVHSAIVSGGAVGADTYAREYAMSNDIPIVEYLPQYGKYARRAPIMRNIQIVDHCDFLLAFWNGISRGTRFTLDYAIRQGVPYRIIRITI